MKKVLKTMSLCILAFCLALSGFLIPALETTIAAKQYYKHFDGSTNGDGLAEAYPLLTATITSPPDGATANVGTCFDVMATISAVCPVATEKNWWPFVQPVHAADTILCRVAAENISATISVTQGNTLKVA